LEATITIQKLSNAYLLTKGNIVTTKIGFIN